METEYTAGSEREHFAVRARRAAASFILTVQRRDGEDRTTLHLSDSLNSIATGPEPTQLYKIFYKDVCIISNWTTVFFSQNKLVTSQQYLNQHSPPTGSQTNRAIVARVLPYVQVRLMAVIHS
jgi:hypothetical protein